MRGIEQLLIEALKSGYTTPALLAVVALLTRRVWMELALTLREWVRSAPARRRAHLETKAVGHALDAPSKDQRTQGLEVLRLLLNAPQWPSLVPPPTDPPPNDGEEQPP
ncbi:hypothetical protein LFM09_38170 [Lentzea alba]|uniref:hypothetical protein n=1 Tax=Lentzea alba TaxID=2714351 RepID=UPI0039BF3C85